MGGGRRKTCRSKQKGGAFELPFFQKAEHAQCVMLPKKTVGGKTRRNRLHKKRKTRRRF